MKILIYGAGKYCNLYLSKLKKNDDTVIGIVDGNSDKWGKDVNGYVINPPDIVEKVQYDKLIIAVGNYESVIGNLLNKKINKRNIFIYDGSNNSLFPLMSIYDKYLESKIYKASAIKQVKTGFLMESFREGEYSEIERIIIIGEKEDYFIINEFFHEINPGKIILFNENINDLQIEKKDKVILCGENYKKDLACIRKKLDSEMQWIVLPLFDVKNLINL